ncbi:MSCRAMM family adhesin SdrC [Halorussus gelatinilyticus]|uniref:MSCRAMM family adhesin SdrC n=1 Tax=Halorussus gelatinilyticus TaxID=2937524 RepID=A0A8U0IEA9_9EURY|nr:MSCRAMM family adhesin SdrC [Halorussus gelatinilyticus]UPV99282.1 MSCRAMM family adhesin SdrC [Halorussus gelatinilyticus]
MSSSDAVTETLDEGSNGFAARLGSLAESVGPALARQAESGNLAAASGVVSLVRAGRTFLRGDRKRGVVQALAGLFWVGVALAQRRSGGFGATGESGTTTGRDESDLSEVATTSPDVEDAVEPGERDADHATGEEVVNTTDADVEESDTAPEIESDADAADVDQRDVTDVSDAVDDDDEHESDADDGSESKSDESTGDAEDEADLGESSETGDSSTGDDEDPTVTDDADETAAESDD